MSPFDSSAGNAMRLGPLLFALSLLSPGCELAVLTAENLADTVAGYTDKVLDCTNEVCLAERAWQAVRKSNPGISYSVYYARGFRDGYVDYLDNGGDGEPPLVAPACYYHAIYHTPAGHRAVDDWFDGFRHGAALAKASGYREHIVVAVSDLPGGPNPAAEAPPGAMEMGPGPPGVEPGATEVLPPPRALPPAP
jgi:hypothetical protein